MVLPHPRSTRTYTLFPYTTLFLSERPTGDASLQVVDLELVGVAFVFFGEQQAIVVRIAPDRLDHAQRALGAGVAEGAQAADGQAVARRRDRETVHAPVELRQRRQDVFALRVLAGPVSVGNVDLVAIAGAVDPDEIGRAHVRTPVTNAHL